ncbi:hypothetical protein FORC26_0740 [Staphylococcus aureus]|nr:hypothetical protein FORC26_0740 [Staphylococcus aureus]
MKRKVLVLTMGVICATQLWHSNHANALVSESVETNFVVKDSDNKNILQTHTEITTEEKFSVVEKSQLNTLKSLSNDNYIEYDLHTNQTGIKKVGYMVIVKLTHHISQTVTNALLDVIMLKKHKA